MNMALPHEVRHIFHPTQEMHSGTEPSITCHPLAKCARPIVSRPVRNPTSDQKMSAFEFQASPREGLNKDIGTLFWCQLSRIDKPKGIVGPGAFRDPSGRRQGSARRRRIYDRDLS